MQRLITSLILIPLVLLLLFYAPAWFLLGIVLLIIGACIYESWQLIPISKRVGQVGFLLGSFFILWFISKDFNHWLIAGMFLWFLIDLAIITFPSSQRFWGYAVITGAICLLVFPLFGQSLIHVYYLPQGKVLLLYVLCLVWASDIGAYLAGKGLGKHKLIPKVSPGKSWEGAVGGFVLAMIIALAFGIYFNPVSWIKWMMLAATIAVSSVFGDLFISMLKRRCHVKDTGSLIPGHGGVLDRLDSLIAALPLFCYIYSSQF